MQPDGYNSNLRRWASAKPAVLADDDPAVFVDYARCVYFNKTLERPAYYGNEESGGHLVRQVKLWLLADKLDDPMTANLVTDNIVGYSLETSLAPNPKAVNFAYNSTDYDSPLRKALRDILHLTCVLFEDLLVDSYHELLHDEIERANQIRRSGMWDERFRFPSDQTCSYHLHHESFPRSKCSSK